MDCYYGDIFPLNWIFISLSHLFHYSFFYLHFLRTYCKTLQKDLATLFHIFMILSKKSDRFVVSRYLYYNLAYQIVQVEAF